MNTPKAALNLDFAQLRKAECKRIDESDLCEDHCENCSLYDKNSDKEYRLFLANLALMPKAAQ